MTKMTGILTLWQLHNYRDKIQRNQKNNREKIKKQLKGIKCFNIL